MHHSGKALGLAVVAAAFIFASEPKAGADVIYTYTGPDFTFSSGLYSGSDFVSGTFDLAAPLADNHSYNAIFPVSFSFSDGVQTIDNSNAATSQFSYISTDSNGVPSGWYIILHGVSTGISDIYTVNHSGTYDFAEYSPSTVTNDAYIASVGTWTVTTAVPSPGSLPLFASGLGALGLLGWRRKRKHAARTAA